MPATCAFGAWVFRDFFEAFRISISIVAQLRGGLARKEGFGWGLTGSVARIFGFCV